MFLHGLLFVCFFINPICSLPIDCRIANFICCRKICKLNNALRYNDKGCRCSEQLSGSKSTMLHWVRTTDKVQFFPLSPWFVTANYDRRHKVAEYRQCLPFSGYVILRKRTSRNYWLQAVWTTTESKFGHPGTSHLPILLPNAKF